MNKKARYKSNFDISLPIKLEKEVNIDFSFIGCNEFNIKKKNKNTKWNEYEGHLIVEVEKPDMDESNKKTHFIMERILQLMSIENRVCCETISIHPPIHLNPEDWKGVEKSAYKDVPVVASIAAEIKGDNFLSIRNILEKIDTIPSRRLIYSIIKVFDEYIKSDYEDKVEEGWKVVDLFIVQSKKTGISDKGPIMLINEFVNDHINQQEAIRIVTKNKKHITDISNFTIVNRDGKERSKDLKQALKANHTKKILMHSLHCIYEVRNLKLHRDETHQAYGSSKIFLDVLLREFWKIRLNNTFIQK